MKNLATLFLLFAFVACKSTQKTNVEKVRPPAQNAFYVSEGGGITGMYNIYLVKTDGAIFKLNRELTDTTAF